MDQKNSVSPAFVLVNPQLGENIGKAARAMLNFGQQDMILVSPRDGWPNASAFPSASGADQVLMKAKLVDTTRQAIENCGLVFASTVRPRGMNKPIVTPKEAVQMMVAAHRDNVKSALLFGPERSGLENDDIILADAILTVPVNPDFGSLNLAQAVILMAYEISQALDRNLSDTNSYIEKASKKDLFGLIDHLMADLENTGFFRSVDRRDTQRRMIFNLVQNASMTVQEVQTWRGIIKSLSRGKSITG